MNASTVTAIAALTGAAIGGFTSITASWLIQHAQVKAQRLAQDQLRRQEIYKEFIKDAAKLYIDALQSEKADVSSLIGLYAELSNMRVLSSASVVDHADQIVKQILNASRSNRPVSGLSASMASRSASSSSRSFATGLLMSSL